MEKDRVSAVPPIENLIVTLMQLNIKVGRGMCQICAPSSESVSFHQSYISSHNGYIHIASAIFKCIIYVIHSAE